MRVLCLVLLLAACAQPAGPTAPPPQPTPNGPRPPEPQPDQPQPMPQQPDPAQQQPEPRTQPPAAPAVASWQGPPLKVRADGADVIVHVDAPTVGYDLRQDRVRSGKDDAEVELTLTSPAADAIVAQMVTPLEVRIAGADLGAARTVRVAIASVQRGAHYLVAPAHELAAVLQR